MKKYFLIIAMLFMYDAIAQPAKKPAQEKPPTQSDMDKMLEDAMKAEGMSKEEQAEMKKLMKDMMPALMEQNAKTADYPEFTSNKQLIPKKDPARIALVSKKIPLQAAMSTLAGSLYTKIITKGPADETNIIKQVLAKTTKASDIHSASILAMMQGHPEAAMALAMKAVQADPTNNNYQNNMAALLTQYGYPEQAIPVLNKLRQQFPGNSTVLSNLAHAWLGLGEIDSVKKFASLAMRVNPSNPESSLCGGLMQELMGDPIKAAEYYENSLDHAPNTFTEAVLKNGGKNPGNEIPDWEKIRRSIAIYEYFPRDWIKTSILTPSVGSYAHNNSLKDGYEKADEQFDDKVDAILKELSREIENLADQGEKAFVKEMGKEMMKGVNFMSKPAVLVLKVLHQYGADMMNKNALEMIDLSKKIDGFRKEYSNSTRNATKCQVYDAAKNKLMQNVNPMVHKFYTEKAELFRQWVNALATWNWYVVGNVKNTVLIQDMGYAAMLEALYNEAMSTQLAENSDCSRQNEIAPADIPAHNIPNFTCPAVVSIPVGPEWQKLTSSSYDFNKNALNIAKSAAAAMPNASLGFGVSNTIAQPGKSGPFAKTANGSITPGNINDDIELTPLTKIEKDWDLTPLPKIPLDELAPLPDLRKSRLAKELLKKMMTADCNGVRNSKDILKEQLDKMNKSIKELEAYEELKNEIKKFGESVEEMESEVDKKQLKDKIEKFQQEVDKVDKYEQWQDSKKNIEKLIQEMDAMDSKAVKDKISKIQTLVDEMDNAPAILKDIQQNGIQTTISSGVQAPGTFTPVKGLFQ